MPSPHENPSRISLLITGVSNLFAKKKSVSFKRLSLISLPSFNGSSRRFSRINSESIYVPENIRKKIDELIAKHPKKNDLSAQNRTVSKLKAAMDAELRAQKADDLYSEIKPTDLRTDKRKHYGRALVRELQYDNSSKHNRLIFRESVGLGIAQNMGFFNPNNTIRFGIAKLVKKNPTKGVTSSSNVNRENAVIFKSGNNKDRAFSGQHYLDENGWSCMVSASPSAQLNNDDILRLLVQESQKTDGNFATTKDKILHIGMKPYCNKNMLSILDKFVKEQTEVPIAVKDGGPASNWKIKAKIGYADAIPLGANSQMEVRQYILYNNGTPSKEITYSYAYYKAGHEYDDNTSYTYGREKYEPLIELFNNSSVKKDDTMIYANCQAGANRSQMVMALHRINEYIKEELGTGKYTKADLQKLYNNFVVAIPKTVLKNMAVVGLNTSTPKFSQVENLKIGAEVALFEALKAKFPYKIEDLHRKTEAEISPFTQSAGEKQKVASKKLIKKHINVNKEAAKTRHVKPVLPKKSTPSKLKHSKYAVHPEQDKIEKKDGAPLFASAEEIKAMKDGERQKLFTDQAAYITKTVKEAEEKGRAFKLVTTKNEGNGVTTYKYCHPDHIYDANDSGKSDKYCITYHIKSDNTKEVEYGEKVQNASVFTMPDQENKFGAKENTITNGASVEYGDIRNKNTVINTESHKFRNLVVKQKMPDALKAKWQV